MAHILLVAYLFQIWTNWQITLVFNAISSAFAFHNREVKAM